VSSFGISGTNAHVIVEESPLVGETAASSILDRPLHVLALSAKSNRALRQLAVHYCKYLDDKVINLADLCFSANTGRGHFSHRLTVVADSSSHLKGKLNGYVSGKEVAGLVSGNINERGSLRIAFLITDEKFSSINIARELYETQPAFQHAIDLCADLIQRQPLEILTDSGRKSEPVALFALKYSLVQLWMSWGIQPQILTGLGIGESVAACLAGVFHLADGLRLIAADSDETVFDIARDIKFSMPRIPFFSMEKGDIVGPEIATVDYWKTSRQKQVDTSINPVPLQDLEVNLCLEVSSHPKLRTLDWSDTISSQKNQSKDQERTSFWDRILYVLTQLYISGAEIDWKNFDRGYNRKKVSDLPTYPFQRQSCWIDLKSASTSSTITTPILELLQQSKVQELVQLLKRNGHKKLDNDLEKALTLLCEIHHQQLMGVGVKDLIYQMKWEEKLLPQQSQQYSPGRWVLMVADISMGEALADHLTRLGHECILVTFQQRSSRFETWIVQPDHPDSFNQFWNEQEQIHSNLPLHGIVHMASLTTPSNQQLREPTDLNNALTIGTRSLLYLIQMVLRNPFPMQLKVWVVTQQAQAISREWVSLVQSPPWGLGRTTCLEHPEFWGGLIDLGYGDSLEAQCQQISDEILGSDNEQEIAYRQGHRYVSRLVPTPELSSSSNVSINAESTYLITGGLGYLGSQFSQQLVKLGARHVVLLGRSGITDLIQEQWIIELKQQGVEIQIYHIDIASPDALNRVLETLRKRMPPIKGIIHAAGVVSDSLLLQQDWTDFHTVMQSKVYGSWNLHQLTQVDQLDFFICFSSITSLLGNRGQSNYASANAFLDGLCQYRASLGQPGLSINWGPWSGGGMVSQLDENQQRRLVNTGIEKLSSTEGLLSFESCLGMSGQVGIVKFDWKAINGIDPNDWKPQFTHLRPGIDQAKKAGVQNNTPWIEIIKETPLEQRQHYFSVFIIDQIRIMLGLSDDEDIPLTKVFTEIGMDSLMMLELRDHLQKTTGLILPATLLLEHPTVAKLAESLTRMVLPSSEAGKASETGSKINPIQDLSMIESMNEDQLESALSQEISRWIKPDPPVRE
jgi:acyl transferase domain-containing protein/acyl carrier protein